MREHATVWQDRDALVVLPGGPDRAIDPPQQERAAYHATGTGEPAPAAGAIRHEPRWRPMVSTRLWTSPTIDVTTGEAVVLEDEDLGDARSA